MVTVMSVFTPALLRSFQPEVHYSVLRDNYGAAGGVVYRFHCMYITITHIPSCLWLKKTSVFGCVPLWLLFLSNRLSAVSSLSN